MSNINIGGSKIDNNDINEQNFEVFINYCNFDSFIIDKMFLVNTINCDELFFFDNLKIMKNYYKSANNIKNITVIEIEKYFESLSEHYTKYFKYIYAIQHKIDFNDEKFIFIMNWKITHDIDDCNFSSGFIAIIKLIVMRLKIKQMLRIKTISSNNNSYIENLKKLLIFNSYYLGDCFVSLIKKSYYSLIWLLMKIIPHKIFNSLLLCEEFNEVWLTVLSSKNQLLTNMFLFCTVPSVYGNSCFYEEWWIIEALNFLIDHNSTILELLVDRIKISKFLNEKCNISKILKYDYFYYISRNTCTLLQKAIKVKNTKALELLFDLPKAKKYIESSVTISYGEYITTLTYACIVGSLECAEYLIKNGASIEKVVEYFSRPNLAGRVIMPSDIEYVIKKASEKTIMAYREKTILECNVLLSKLRSFYRGKIMISNFCRHNINLEHDTLENLNINIMQNIFNCIISDWIPKKNKISLNFEINKLSYGCGVLRHVLGKFANFYTKKSGLLTPFTSNIYNTEKSNNVNLFDPDNNYMYLPYYEERPSDFILESYVHFGIFLALCLIHEPIELRLSPLFFVHNFYHEENKYEETLMQCLPSYLSTNLKTMKSYTDYEFDNLYIMMSTFALNNFGIWKEYELIPEGLNIQVTRENFEIYKSKLLNFYQNGYRNLILEKINYGFTKVFDDGVLMYPHIKFLLINKCQDRESVENWIKYSNIFFSLGFKYDNLAPDDYINQSPYTPAIINKLNHIFRIKKENISCIKSIIWFFEILKTLDDNDYGNLLQFIHGNRTLPLGGLSLLCKSATPLTIIYDNNNRKQSFLPTSETCFNRITIYLYPSLEVMRTCLLTAIRHCNTFEFK